jgi:type II secretory pathway predicted ATPase ExeA
MNAHVRHPQLLAPYVRRSQSPYSHAVVKLVPIASAQARAQQVHASLVALLAVDQSPAVKAQAKASAKLVAALAAHQHPVVASVVSLHLSASAAQAAARRVPVHQAVVVPVSAS